MCTIYQNVIYLNKNDGLREACSTHEANVKFNILA